MLLTGTPDELDRDGPRSHRRYDGKYLGFVRDSSDPEKRGRVRVHCPEVMGDIDSEDQWLGWAEASAFGAGLDTGLFAVPADPTSANRDIAETRVWIEFRNGDPSRPIYSGGPWFGGGSEFPDHIPPLSDGIASGGDETTQLPNYVSAAKVALVDADTGEVTEQEEIGEPGPSSIATYPNNTVWKTPAGHVFEVDNTPEGERIRVFHKSGTYWEIRPDGTHTQKVEGNATSFVARDSKRVVKGSDLVLVEGASHAQVNSAAVEVFRGSRTSAVEGVAKEFYSGGQTVEVTGLQETSAGTVSVTAGTVQTVSAGELGFAGETVVVVGATSLEATSSSTKVSGLASCEVKCPVGVTLVANLAATERIYASTAINAALLTIETALNGIPTPPPSDPYGAILIGLKAAVIGITATIRSNTTIHKVSIS